MNDSVLAGTGAMGEFVMKALREDRNGVEVTVADQPHRKSQGKAFAEQWKIPLLLDEPRSVPRSTRRRRRDPHDAERSASRSDDSWRSAKGKHVQVEIPMSLSLARRRSAWSRPREDDRQGLHGDAHAALLGAAPRDPPPRSARAPFHLHHMVVETYFFRRDEPQHARRSRDRGWTTCSWHHGLPLGRSRAVGARRCRTSQVWGQKGPDHATLGIPMDITVAMKSKTAAALHAWRCRSTTRDRSAASIAISARRRPRKVYRDSMTDSDGKDVPLDGVPAFDRQDVEFIERHPRRPPARVQRTELSRRRWS